MWYQWHIHLLTPFVGHTKLNFGMIVHTCLVAKCQHRDTNCYCLEQNKTKIHSDLHCFIYDHDCQFSVSSLTKGYTNSHKRQNWTILSRNLLYVAVITRSFKKRKMKCRHSYTDIVKMRACSPYSDHGCPWCKVKCAQRLNLLWFLSIEAPTSPQSFHASVVA